ncbi:MAG: hypothetical protein IPP41_09550 [Rhodocyclaceae bacterium]|nr:hypothetical protein [Rhodocyclaceae bacterium]
MLIVVAYCLSILAILVKWTWSGNKRAKALLTAFSPLLILTGLIVPGLYFLKISFNWTIPPTMLGSGLTMILMAIALADRFEEARQAKETAQRELVDGLHSKERELEARVVQRTEDLSQASLAFQSVLENAQDAVVLTDQDGRITNWNREARIDLWLNAKQRPSVAISRNSYFRHTITKLLAFWRAHQSNQRDSARRKHSSSPRRYRIPNRAFLDTDLSVATATSFLFAILQRRS